jgi:hypothetical protein
MFLETPDANRVERRACQRHSCEADRWRLEVAIGKAAWTVQVRDLSTHGLGLLFDSEMEADQLALVEIYNPARRLAVLKAIRLHYAVPQADGRCLVGVSFLRPLSNREFEEVLAGVRGERRQVLEVDSKRRPLVGMLGERVA